MKLTTILLALLVLAALAGISFAASRAKRPGSKATGDVQAKRPLTDREQAMFFRLKACFPENVVLAQVAFSALLETRDRATRSTYDRKVADFVLCRKDFTPIAIVELDDSTHRGREDKDAKRDAILTGAGYSVLRFKNIPDAADLTAALALPPA